MPAGGLITRRFHLVWFIPYISASNGELLSLMLIGAIPTCGIIRGEQLRGTRLKHQPPHRRLSDAVSCYAPDWFSRLVSEKVNKATFHFYTFLIFGMLFMINLLVPALAQDDPLPSWNDGSTKQAIVNFVGAVSEPSSPDFVLPEDRIATFDNDGTLWTEHPMYTQLAFAVDRIRQLAPQNPEWKTKQPFKAVLDNNIEALGDAGKRGLVELIMASHAGMTTEEFEEIVTEWFSRARHPRFNLPYTELAFQPMIELMRYLRANEFKTFIVSGGGIEFMRPITNQVYGIPSEQVIGSSIETKYGEIEGKPVLQRLPRVDFIDDRAGKPVGINKFIGKRPIAAFGNSAGDREMLRWTGAGEGARLMGLVFHNDSEREYSYGPAEGLPDTKFGTFPPDLMEEAEQKGWLIISMKDDWKQVFPQRN